MENRKKVRRLEKFKDCQSAKELDPSLEAILAQLIECKTLNQENLLNLAPEQIKGLEGLITAGYLTLAGEDREKLIEATEEVISEKSRNEIWENNHRVILGMISWHVMSQYKFPQITQIAEETGLSRVTVTKHLKEYYGSESYKLKEKMYFSLREKLMARIYDYAFQGNMRAAKIYLDATSPNFHPTSCIKNQQNNFIQINGTIIHQEQLSKLPESKQTELMEILKLL